MITNAYSLYDTKGLLFTSPIFLQNNGFAMRACLDLASDLSTQFGRHPGDFVLFHIGTFDDQTGKLEEVLPVNLGTLASFLPTPPKDLFAKAQQ